MLALIPPPFSALTSLWNLFPLVCDAHTHPQTHTHTQTLAQSHAYTHTHTHIRTDAHTPLLTYTHTHTHTSKSSVHIRWSARTKTTYTQCNCDRIQLESKFAQGKERSVCLEIKGVAAIGERRKQREKQKKSNRQRERERERAGRPKDRKREGEEGSGVAPHLDPDQRQDVHGGPINGPLLRVMESFSYSLQGRQTGSRRCAWGIQVLRRKKKKKKGRTPNLFRSFKEKEISSSTQ